MDRLSVIRLSASGVWVWHGSIADDNACFPRSHRVGRADGLYKLVTDSSCSVTTDEYARRAAHYKAWAVRRNRQRDGARMEIRRFAACDSCGDGRCHETRLGRLHHLLGRLRRSDRGRDSTQFGGLGRRFCRFDGSTSSFLRSLQRRDRCASASSGRNGSAPSGSFANRHARAAGSRQ